MTALARSPNLQDPHTATFVLARGPGAASYTRLVSSSLIGHIKRGDLIAVRKAISEGADLYEEDSQCWTPLFHAAYRGDIAILQLLIDGGADVNHGAFSALHWAAMGGHLEVVKELLRAGATIPAETLACRNYLSAEMRALLRCENSPA